MNKLLWIIAGTTLYLAYRVLANQPRQPAPASAPVDDLAHKLQDAWADHHTVA